MRYDLPAFALSVRDSFLSLYMGKIVIADSVDITPLGAPRMTKKSVYLHQDYFAYQGMIRAAFNRTSQYEACEGILVLAQFRSTSSAQFHTVKPDFDNILKGVADALIRLDQRAYYGACLKFYGPTSRLDICLVEPVDKPVAAAKPPRKTSPPRKRTPSCGWTTLRETCGKKAVATAFGSGLCHKHLDLARASWGSQDQAFIKEM